MRVLMGAAAGIAAALSITSAAMAQGPACTNPDALGVSRTVEIDTTGGPGFGMEHYKAYDFLQPKEVVLTFDDGPQKYSTEAVLDALGKECVKATFFSVGKMALGYPGIIREVAHQGHTVGTHTWSHKAISKSVTFEAWRDEMERGASAVHRAVGGQVASFFRFPTLRDSPESIAYLGKRNISMFSTDVDSFDFKRPPPAKLVKGVMQKLEKRGKGIILMHDIHMNTAKAVPLLLEALKKDGYKIVHLTAKAPLETLPEFDKAIEKDTKGLPAIGAEKPMASVVKTVEGVAPPEEQAEEKAAEQAAEGDAAKSTASGDQGDDVASPAENAPAQPSAEPASISTPAKPPVDAYAPAAAKHEALSTSSIATPSNDAHGESEQVGSDDVDAGTKPRSWSDRAKATWELWFGK